MSSTNDVDRLLVERVQAGETWAFDMLVSKYQHRLMRLVSRIVHDHAEAEDVVQETFIKAYRALRFFRGDAQFYTWLFRIGVNTAKNARVRQSRDISSFSSSSSSGEFADDYDHAEQVPDNNTPESIMATKQIAEAINLAIDSLSLSLRTAIVLREIEGLSYEAISEIMDCPVGTVRSRIFRAREVIVMHIKPLFDGPLDGRW
jgi:RNA polymerase sigma-70 factor (ECF subfamily)